MKKNIIKSLIPLCMLLVIVSLSLGNGYINRDFQNEYDLGDVIEIKIGLNAQTEVDIAEYIPTSMHILNWTNTPNVKVERRVFENHQILWFSVSGGQAYITYSLLPKYAGDYRVKSIITTPEGFEKEIMDITVKRSFDISPFIWVIYLFGLILFIKLVEKSSEEEK